MIRNNIAKNIRFYSLIFRRDLIAESWENFPYLIFKV